MGRTVSSAPIRSYIPMYLLCAYVYWVLCLRNEADDKKFFPKTNTKTWCFWYIYRICHFQRRVQRFWRNWISFTCFCRPWFLVYACVPNFTVSWVLSGLSVFHFLSHSGSQQCFTTYLILPTLNFVFKIKLSFKFQEFVYFLLNIFKA